MTPVEYFGEQLRKAGYNYHGTERMYSGITGEEFEVFQLNYLALL